MKTGGIGPSGHEPRVVMVSAEYLPDVLGGAERQCQKLSAALVRRGRRVTVVTSRTRPGHGASSLDGVEVIRLRCRSSPQLGGRRLLSSIVWGARLYRWVGVNRADIVVLHAHQAKMNAVWAAVAGWRYRIPLVVKVGTASPEFDLDRLVRKRYLYGRVAAALVTRRAARFVAISDAVEGDLRRFGVSDVKIARMPNGVELADHPVTPQERADARRRLGLPIDGTAFVFTGRLSPQKNLPLLIDVFERLAADRHDIRLVLVGDGELRAGLERRVATSTVSSQVLFTGAVDDVTDHLRAADAIVLPSYAEGMSNSVLEAMSVGVVPIASAVGGTVDLITTGVDGLVFDLDAGSLLHALETFIAADLVARSALAAAAYRRAAEHHDIDALAVAYEELYDEVADGNGGATWGSGPVRLEISGGTQP